MRVSVINESGMYSLVLSSKKPKAREFKRWVTSEVLPNNGNADVSAWYSVT
ncbi:BRO-N domain-containing protein, partial [Burkholderia sp. AW33-5]